MLCATRFVCYAKPPYGVLSTVYLKYAPKWTSAGRKDVISLPRNRTMCNRLQVITSLPVCAKRAVTYVRHWNNLFWGCLRGMTLCATRFVCYAKPPYGVLSTVYLKYAPKWTSAGRKDVISLPRNRTMCNRLQVITSLPVCAKCAVTFVRHWNNLFWGCLRGVTLCAARFVC